MNDDPETVRVAVAQASPVFLDQDASLDKALRLIGGAASQGALLVVIGEAWLPGYPIHAGAPFSSELWWEFSAEYLDRAIDLSGPIIDALCAGAAKADIDVIIGVVERDPGTRGSVYSTLAFIGREGDVIDRHRKLRPSPQERAIWGDGDAASLQVHDRGYANLSALLSCEHQMVLPTYALAEQGTEIHAACWPGQLRTSGPGASSWPDQHLLSRAFAVQAGAYVLCAGTILTRNIVPEKYRDLVTHEFVGGSAIIDPHGEIIAGPIEGQDLIFADCSLALVRSAKVAFDCAGHSSRRDQLQFTNISRSGDQMESPVEPQVAGEPVDAGEPPDQPPAS